jgi:hypothetical protein
MATVAEIIFTNAAYESRGYGAYVGTGGEVLIFHLRAKVLLFGQ